VLYSTVPSQSQGGCAYGDTDSHVGGLGQTLNKPHAFEVSTSKVTEYFLADNEREKEDWINAVGRAIVRRSARCGRGCCRRER
jgi:hypothetical protein